MKDDIEKILDIKREIEKKIDGEISYHGLKNLNPDRTYPLFVQWNHPHPIISIDTKKETKFLQLPAEIGYAIEKIMGNVKDKDDFNKQIKDAFKKKIDAY